MHLSFQEYFAALYLASQVKLPRWIDGKATGPGPSLEDLRSFAGQAPWRETLILLFELLAAERGWPQELAAQIFGDGFEKLTEGRKEHRTLALLAAELAVDPHSGFGEALRRRAAEACIRWEGAFQAVFIRGSDRLSFHQPEVLRLLLAGDAMAPPEALAVLADTALKAETLNLSGTQVSGLEPLQRLTQLQVLDLRGTQVADLAPLRSLTQLRALELSGTQVANLAPLQSLTRLRDLSLSGTQVADLAPLQSLTQLELLYLDGTQVADLAPLQELPQLQYLDLIHSAVAPEEAARLRRNLPGLETNGP